MKDCPFCGSKNLKRPERNSCILWVGCLDCKAEGPIYSIPYASTQQFEILECFAIDLWDERK
jgi:hypothetical protein